MGSFFKEAKDLIEFLREVGTHRLENQKLPEKGKDGKLCYSKREKLFHYYSFLMYLWFLYCFFNFGFAFGINVMSEGFPVLTEFFSLSLWIFVFCLFDWAYKIHFYAFYNPHLIKNQVIPKLQRGRYLFSSDEEYYGDDLPLQRNDT